MRKFKLANGWTKETVMAQIRKYNNGSRSLSEHKHEGCEYLSVDGNRCAIGCFIPDNHPGLNNPDFVSLLISKYPELEDFMPFAPQELSRFQSIHDNAPEGRVYEEIEKFLNTEVE